MLIDTSHIYVGVLIIYLYIKYLIQHLKECVGFMSILAISLYSRITRHQVIQIKEYSEYRTHSRLTVITAMD